MDEYYFMTSQTGVFGMVMARTGYDSYSYMYRVPSQSFSSDNPQFVLSKFN